MPIAAVNKHRTPARHDHDVWCPWNSARVGRNPMPESRNNLSDHQLWRSPTLPNATHQRRALRRSDEHSAGRPRLRQSATWHLELNSPARRTVTQGRERMTNTCGTSAICEDSTPSVGPRFDRTSTPTGDGERLTHSESPPESHQPAEILERAILLPPVACRRPSRPGVQRCRRYSSRSPDEYRVESLGTPDRRDTR